MLLVTRVAGVESLPVGPFVSLAWLGINCAGKADVYPMGASHPGQLPKWPNGADCKSAVDDFGGSNPSLPT